VRRINFYTWLVILRKIFADLLFKLADKWITYKTLNWLINKPQHLSLQNNAQAAYLVLVAWRT